jgi:hypothetical protein
MKVIVFVKATPNSEKGCMPSEQLMEDMTRFNEELVKAGIMLSGDGLKPSAQGKRVRFADGQTTVIDGPFAETKELVAGFWVWNVKSMDEALAWARRCPNPMPGEEGVLEIRPVYELADFGDAVSPDIAAREEQMRQQIESRTQ